MTEPSPTAAPPAAPEPPAGHELALAWARAHPLEAVLAGALALTLVLFYVAVPLFIVPFPARHLSAFQWIWSAWNPKPTMNTGRSCR